MDTAAFRQWLLERGLGQRSAGDVCSRLNRVVGLVDIGVIKSKADLEVAFIRSSAVQALTVSVRSQLKRAAVLWLEFQGARQ